MRFFTKKIPITPKKKSGLSSKDILEQKVDPPLNLKDAKKLLDKKMKKSDIEFMIDENILGIDRYLKSFDIKFRSVGDPDCPPRGSDDPIVAKFAKEHGLVVVTNDDKLQKQCELLDIPYVAPTLSDLARKVKAYTDSH